MNADHIKLISNNVASLSSLSQLLYLALFCVIFFAAKALIGSLLTYRRYYRRSHLLTPTEVRSYRRIEPACRAIGLSLMAQVRIADVIRVKGKGRGFWRAFTKISSKHVDFVIVDSAFNVVGCIEIDDSSHHKKERRERDKFVNKVFDVVGLPLLRCVPGQEQKIISELKLLKRS